MAKQISQESFVSLKAKGWTVTTNSHGFVCCKDDGFTGPLFDSAQEAWVYIEKMQGGKRICTIEMLRYELRNVMQYGMQKHKGDHYAEWCRTRNGTLSWDWF